MDVRNGKTFDIEIYKHYFGAKVYYTKVIKLSPANSKIYLTHICLTGGLP